MLHRGNIARLETRLHASISSERNLRFCEKHYGVEIACYHEQSDGLGGDVWGIYPYNSDTLLIYQFDYLGHDERSAYGAVTFHRMAQHAAPFYDGPAGFLATLNGMIRESALFPFYVSMFVAEYHRDTQQLRYASAAAPPAYIVAPRLAHPQALTYGSLPLGAVETPTYDIADVTLEDHDCLVIYSDALLETGTDGPGKGQLFDEPFLQLLQQYCDHDGGVGDVRLCGRITEQFLAFSTAQIADDVTLMTITINAKEAGDE